MTFAKLASILLALLLVPGLLAAQDVSGMWDITAEFNFPSEGGPRGAATADCQYSGQGISLVQNGEEVSGTVDLNLVSGIEKCPGQMTGDLVAEITRGTSFAGTIDGGKEFGEARVDGSISSGAKAPSAVQAANSVAGNVTNIGGTFSGASGTFSGQQLPAMPTLGPVAVGIMALILFGGSILLLTRRGRLST